MVQTKAAIPEATGGPEQLNPAGCCRRPQADLRTQNQLKQTPRKWGCSSVWKCFVCISMPWRRLPSAARAFRSLAFSLYQFHIHKTSRWSRAACSICPSNVMVIYTEPLRKSEVRRVTALCSPWYVQQPQAGIEILLSEMDTLLDRGALTSWVFCAEVLGGNAN